MSSHWTKRAKRENGLITVKNRLKNSFIKKDNWNKPSPALDPGIKNADYVF